MTFENETFDCLEIFAKNARLNNADRLSELAVELGPISWDLILFSETRSSHHIVELQQSTSTHICFGTGLPTISAGVAILVHARHRHTITDVKISSTRVMHLDMRIGCHDLRIIAAYAPHAGYSHEEFHAFFDQLHRLVAGAYRAGRRVILGGDFNLQLDVGQRGAMFAEFCAGFGFVIANDDSHHDLGVETWTFCSSMGARRRIDFILCSRSLSLVASHASDDLDVGSDHRAVLANFKLQKSKRKKKYHKRKIKRGWKPILDDSGIPTQYHDMLNKSLRSCRDSTLRGLENICKDVVRQLSDNDRLVHAWDGFQDSDFQSLLEQRKLVKSPRPRAELSKKIRKQLRRKLREQRASRIQHVLEEFSALDRLHACHSLPVRYLVPWQHFFVRHWVRVAECEKIAGGNCGEWFRRCTSIHRA